MTTDVITPAEAWEEVERRQLTIDYNKVASKWCASAPDHKWDLGWGSNPLEAVGNLLVRIADEQRKAAAVTQ